MPTTGQLSIHHRRSMCLRVDWSNQSRSHHRYQSDPRWSQSPTIWSSTIVNVTTNNFDVRCRSAVSVRMRFPVVHVFVFVDVDTSTVDPVWVVMCGSASRRVTSERDSAVRKVSANKHYFRPKSKMSFAMLTSTKDTNVCLCSMAWKLWKIFSGVQGTNSRDEGNRENVWAVTEKGCWSV